MTDQRQPVPPRSGSRRRRTSVVERGGGTVIETAGIVMPVVRIGRDYMADGRWYIRRYGREWVIEGTNDARKQLIADDPVKFNTLGEAVEWIDLSLNTYPEAR